MSADWNSLKKHTHATLRSLERRRVTHAEAFYTQIKAIEVTIRNSEILTQNRMLDSGVGFRVMVPENKVGFACTNSPSGEVVQQTGEKASSIARVSSEIPYFDLPKADQPSDVQELFDSQLAQETMENAVDFADQAIRSAEAFDNRVTAKDGRILVEFGQRGIANTLGVDYEERLTRTIQYLGGNGKQNNEVTSSCYDAVFSRAADFMPEVLGENVGKMIVELFNPQPIESFQGTVIFGPEAVSYQLVDVIIEALKGENVIAGSSMWAKNLGKTVASQELSVTDNAILPGGFSSRSFDDEGYPSQKTILISEGRLKSFLHNVTSANNLKTSSTGNASRSATGYDFVRWLIGSGYRVKPRIYASNLMIHPRGQTKEELISEIDKGVLIESMSGFPQAGSGLVSAQLSRAFFVKHGEIQHAIKGGMVTGVVFDWLKNVSAVSKDTKTFANAIVPSLQVEDVKVVGG